MRQTRCTLLVAALLAAGCGSSARLPVTAGTGPNPTLPPPDKALIPLVHVVTAKGWPQGAAPVAADGTAVNAFASGLEHPRWLYVLPNGDVLVAETNAPPRPEDNKGIKGFFFKKFQAKAGGAVPSANRITLLRDADGDGVAETRTAFLTGLNSPFGMTLVGKDLYVANSDAVVRFPYEPGATEIKAAGTKLADLPAGPWASPPRKGPPCRSGSARGCSWVSTAPGTASRAAATRSSSCPSRRAGRPASRSTS